VRIQLRSLYLCAICACTQTIVEAQTIIVEPSVAVSPVASGGHFWGTGNTHAAPDDPLSLITCGIRIRSDPLSWEAYLYRTADGGQTWNTARVDATSSDTGRPDMVSETACALGRRGSMYMNSSVYGRYYSQPFRLAYSSDHGRTWERPLTRRDWYDATQSVVDNTGGRFDGTLYIFSDFLFDRRSQLSGAYEPLLTSIDHGLSVFPARSEKPTSSYAAPGWPSQSVVLGSGTVMAVRKVEFAGTDSAKGHVGSANRPVSIGIEVVASSDGGKSLEPPILVRKWNQTDILLDGELRDDRGLTDAVTAIGTDSQSSSYKGRVYVAWREADTLAAVSRIMLAWSDDAGKTWAAPNRVDDAPRDSAHSLNVEDNRAPDPTAPSIAVAPDGTVGLTWLENRFAPSIRFSASFDGGKSFKTSVSVYDAEHFSKAISTSWVNNYATVQDYANVGVDSARPDLGHPGISIYTQASPFDALAATTDGVFHAMWNTRSDGVLRTARIRINRKFGGLPTLDISKLADVSRLVRLEAENFHYDENSGSIVVDAILMNASAPIPERYPSSLFAKSRLPRSLHPRTLESPLILNVTYLKSALGDLELANPDGVDTSGNLLLDWSEFLPDGGLPAGAMTRPRRLEFRIKRPRPPDTDTSVTWLLSLNTRAFSRNDGH
jgi:hypothetical protein